MGYPMAVNLRNGLSPEYTLLICDVNKEALQLFIKQTEGNGPVKIVETGLEAIAEAVSQSFMLMRTYAHLYDFYRTSS